MDEPSEVKIVTPAMSVEPRWFEDIISARTPVLVFRDFLPPVMSQDLIRDLELCAESIRISSYLNATLTTLGPYLAKYVSCPGEYFRQVSDIQPVLPQSLTNMECTVYQLVMQWLQLEALNIALEPVLGEYSGSVVRFHANGIANPLHNDNISRDAAGTGLIVTQVTQQLSCVVCLQACTSGGALRIFNKKWGLEDEQFKVEFQLGYADEVVDGYEFCEFSPQRGDVYIFNPNFYHEIDHVVGTTRITMGFFFGLTDPKGKEAIAWS